MRILISIRALEGRGSAPGVVTGDWLTGVSVMTLMICISSSRPTTACSCCPIAVSFHWMQEPRPDLLG